MQTGLFYPLLYYGIFSTLSLFGDYINPYSIIGLVDPVLNY